MNDALNTIQDQLFASGLAEYIALLERVTGSETKIDTFVEIQRTNWSRAMNDFGLPENPTSDAFLDAVHTRVAALNTALQEQLHLHDVSSAAGWEQLITHLRAKFPAEAFSGFFVKPEVIANQLRIHPPQATLNYLGYTDIETALHQESVFELMVALRFSETESWMETFLQTYQQLGPDDFSERPVEFLLLNPDKWWKLAEPFALKKKHHFSHLKELGVVFSYPAPGSQSSGASELAAESYLHLFIAMTLHYIFEVRFYSDFFRANMTTLNNFGQAFIEILKGDTNMCAANQFQLPIIQQYHLKKPHPNPCVFQPHVMPEVLHWHKARQALLQLVADHPQHQLFEFWNSCYTVGSVQSTTTSAATLLTLNFADNILSHQEVLSYHFKEDLWNNLFTLYFSEAELEQTIIKNFAAKAIDLRQLMPQLGT